MSTTIEINKRHISAPWTVACVIVGSAFSSGGTFYALRGDLAANQDRTVRVERESVERDARLERRIEKVEDTTTKTLGTLERIDERTVEMKRQLDRIAR